MRFEAIPFAEVKSDLLQQWSKFQDSSDALASPFFSPEFSQIIGNCRDDLTIAIIEDETGITGLLPFHRKSGGCGVPLAGQYCDYQGVIGAAPSSGDIPLMLSGIGLSSFDYNHALSEQAAFRTHAFWQSNSPRADLRAGYEAWRTEVSSNTKALKSLARKERKISREIGPLRFVEHDATEESWRIFRVWKDQALHRLGQPGFPGPSWVEAMIDALRAADSPSFNGCFSTLYAGDRLIGAHFGMRSARVWHWWFPSYDIDLSAYSPGLLLLRYCVESAAKNGYAELDLGRGAERYKLEFSNRSRSLCEGSFERANLVGATRGMRKAVQRAATRLLPDRKADIVRRGATKLLRAGLL